LYSIAIAGSVTTEDVKTTMLQKYVTNIATSSNETRSPLPAAAAAPLSLLLPLLSSIVETKLVCDDDTTEGNSKIVGAFVFVVDDDLVEDSDAKG
jgi:hypothetical protein